MPYGISNKQPDCSAWATVIQEDDGSYTTLACHDTKQEAIDQMVAVSIAEDLEPLGEVRAIGNVPEFIKKNAQRGLDYLAKGFGGDGLTDATKREAREMAAGRISENKVRKMAPWFARHKADGQAPKNNDPSNSEYPGAGLVAWLLWGGNSNFDSAAQDWAQRQIDKLDNETNKARSKMKKTEHRTFTVRNIEARQAEDGTLRMAGYAAVFNEPSLPLPFTERIAPGAFTKTLQETPDVRLLINHEGLPMARTKNGTMRLYEDQTGLYFEAELADTQEARDLHTLVARGDVDQMSFAFRVIRQNWNKDRTERTLTEVSLADGDVSIVTYPAYPATSVEAREAIKRAALALKEGRQLSPETTVALQSILEKLSESYDNLEEGKDLLEVMLGLKTLEPTVEVEDPEVELEPTAVMPETCDCCDAGCECGDCMACGGMQEMAANVIDVIDVPGQGAKIVGDHPSVLNFLPDNLPRKYSLRLAQAKRNTIK